MICEGCEAKGICEVHDWEPCERVRGYNPVKPHPTYLKRLKMAKNRARITNWLRVG